MTRPERCDRATCPAPSHDTASGYHYGCRSLLATDAHRLAAKRRREGRHTYVHVPALGTIRRIRALCALGWRMSDIAERIGGTANQKWIAHLAAGDREQVWRSTEQQVRVVFAELAMALGPSAHARNRAAAKGWVPPLAWDDLDDPGERPKLGSVRPGKARWDAVAVRADVARMSRAGDSAVAIAERLGISERSVVRIRAEQRNDEVAA